MGFEIPSQQCLGGSIYFLGPLEKGILKFEMVLELFSYIFGWQPLEKGILIFEIALDVFISFFGGGNSWKRGSWNYKIALGLFNFFWWRPLENAVLRFEIALGVFFYQFFWAATLGKRGPEI